MRLKRSYLAVAILIVALIASFAYIVQQDTTIPQAPPRTMLKGAVYSVQPNSNFSLIFFVDLKTSVTYGVAIMNSTGSVSTCRIQPCTYATSLYSNEQYNVTIEVIATTRIGGLPQDCAAQPAPFTPSGATMSIDFTSSSPPCS